MQRKWSIHVVDTKNMGLREFRLVEGPTLSPKEEAKITTTYGSDRRIGVFDVRPGRVAVTLLDSTLWTCNGIVTCDIRETLGEV